MRRSDLLYLAGMLVIALGLMVVPKAGWAAYGDYLSTISTGSLNQPTKVAVDQANGDVYVTDAGNKAVKKYDKTGTLVAGFSLSVSGTPVGIAVNSTNIFVGDSTNKCVWIYDKNGALTDLLNTGISHKFGGANGTKLSMPNTITIAPSGHIFVVDGDNDKVYIFRADGTQNSSFGTAGAGTSTGTTIYLYYPIGLAMANSTSASGIATQYFYLGDQGNNRVQKLYYSYNESTKAITTAPTYVLSIGSKGDAFSQFLRISDVSWDCNYATPTIPGTLYVTDSLQMVVQRFQSDATMTAAFNYSGSAVQGYLNIPTGSAVDHPNQKLYIASNQGAGIVKFDIQNGASPTIGITDPASATTPCTATYTVAFSGTDSDSDTASVNLYYYNTSTPTVKHLFSTQNLTVTGGAYSGTAILDLVGVYPNLMAAGTYGVYAEVADPQNNRANTTAAGTVGITLVAGKTNYTCSMQAKWDPTNTGTVDTDSDGLLDIDEIEGTYNTLHASAMTDPAKVDSDNDGLDDAVEEGRKAASSNIPVPLTGGVLSTATDPNDVDTDNGGVSDAVEIAKATSPTAGADDLVVASSAQDVVCDYFLDQSPDLQSSTITYRNLNSVNAVVDLAFYNLNGTLNKSVPAAFVLAPNQCVRFNPLERFGVTEASVEVRSTATRIAGDLIRYNHNYIKPQSLDMGGGGNMWWPDGQGTHLYSVVFGDNDSASLRFRSFINIKNWSDSATNVTVNFYRNTDGALVSTGPIPLAGHGVTNLRPRDYVPSWTGGCMEVVSDSQVSASMYMLRFNAADSNANDVSFIYPFDKTTASTTYGPVWSDSSLASYRFIGYIYAYNPNSTAITATYTITDGAGAVAATKDFTLQPYMKVGMRPSNNGVPSNITGGMFKVSSVFVADGTPAPHISAIYLQRYSATAGTSLIDWAYYLSSYTDTGVTTQHVGNIRDYPYSEPDQRFIGYCYVWNTDAVNTLNATVTYYNPDGTINKTVNRAPLGPGARVGWRPGTGADAAPKECTASITADRPFVGFTMGQEWNVDDTSIIDFGFGKKFWR